MLIKHSNVGLFLTVTSKVLFVKFCYNIVFVDRLRIKISYLSIFKSTESSLLCYDKKNQSLCV